MSRTYAIDGKFYIISTVSIKDTKNFLFILAIGKLTNKIEVANDQTVCKMDLYVTGKHSVFTTNSESQLLVC